MKGHTNRSKFCLVALVKRKNTWTKYLIQPKIHTSELLKNKALKLELSWKFSSNKKFQELNG